MQDKKSDDKFRFNASLLTKYYIWFCGGIAWLALVHYFSGELLLWINTSCSTCSGRRSCLLHVTTFPDAEKSLSLETCVAGIERYIRAILDSTGYRLFPVFFHQR